MVKGGSGSKESTYQCRRPRFDPWVRKIPWRREWQPTPVFLPEESHGQRSLAGYSPWGHKDSDATEWLSMHTRQVLEGESTEHGETSKRVLQNSNSCTSHVDYTSGQEDAEGRQVGFWCPLSTGNPQIGKYAQKTSRGMASQTWKGFCLMQFVNECLHHGGLDAVRCDVAAAGWTLYTSKLTNQISLPRENPTVMIKCWEEKAKLSKTGPIWTPLMTRSDESEGGGQRRQIPETARSFSLTPWESLGRGFVNLWGQKGYLVHPTLLKVQENLLTIDFLPCYWNRKENKK